MSLTSPSYFLYFIKVLAALSPGFSDVLPTRHAMSRVHSIFVVVVVVSWDYALKAQLTVNSYNGDINPEHLTSYIRQQQLSNEWNFSRPITPRSRSFRPLPRTPGDICVKNCVNFEFNMISLLFLENPTSHNQNSLQFM